ncbi:DUF4179 domain-containing protein [Terrisporobacter sp.]|uniref:DUF4179 domain-containing protein n=1 Tax=Terrisporobacter sp. TaxID=1965305 RepID=UPI0026066C97|nr:DUF4179 domain-containing protein [Terrisporobacter sp.]
MSKIHEILNKSNSNDLLDNEEPLNNDEKQRILNMTMSKITADKNKSFGKRKLIVAVLIATMMIGTVAMANEYIESNLDNSFLNFFGIDKNDISLDAAGEDINKTVSNNGLDLTVTQTLGDRHMLYILVDITTPKNIKIPKYPTFNEYDIYLDNRGSAGWGMEELEDYNPNDNKYRYLVSYNTESNLNDDRVTLDFKDFGYYSEKDNEFITLIKGNWKLSWDLKYKNLSKKFKVNHFVKENNYKSIITSIEVSPISISVNLLGDSYNNFVISSITMKDGTTYDTGLVSSAEKNNLFLGGSTSTSFFKSYHSINFSQIINVEDIKSITIGNEIIQIKN